MSEQVNASHKEFTDTADGLNKIAELCAMDKRVSRGTIHTIEIAAIKLQKAAALLDVMAHAYEAARAERDELVRELPNVCYGDCAGDPGVGVPSCPLYEYPDYNIQTGERTGGGCKYQADAKAPNKPASVLRGNAGSPFDEPFDHSGDATAAVAPVNRVLSLQEVLALPKGTRCTIEDRKWGFARLIIPVILPSLAAYGKDWRIWLDEDPPTEDQQRADPWEVEG